MPKGKYRVEIPLTRSTVSELSSLSSNLALGLDLEEMQRLQHYFKTMGREPTDIELQAMAQAWSEHCCYKSSKFYLKRYFSGLSRGNAILAMEDDAGVVEFDQDHAYVIQMESHNHPSAIEPYGGAATGVGGILRDILCMGAQPVALLDSIFLGETWKKHEPGALSQRFLFENIVGGIRDYGNRVGIPNVAGSVDFDSTFNRNPLVNAGCVGIVRKDSISRSRASNVGDVFVLCGGGTGRDGIHGVNFASENMKDSSSSNRGVVQLGNPIVKEPLIHAVLEANEAGLISGMKDLGGGGLSSSVGEMCLAGGVSAVIDLDRVILKEDGLEPWEIWVSESQERMLLAVNPSNLERISKIFSLWDVSYSIIGKIVEGKNLIIRYGGEVVLDLDLEFLTSGPVYCRNYTLPEKKSRDYVLPSEPDNILDLILSFLKSPYGCSREAILRQYDHTVRGSTIIRPISGKPNYETHSDAAVIRPVRSSMKGLALTSGSKFDMVAVDPVGGTYATMFEAFMNLLVTGARPDSVVDCLNFGNPQNPAIMGSFIQVASSISEFCSSFNLPVVAGNVSLYNETNGLNIKPTPTIMMVGIVEDISKAVTTDFKKPGNSIYILGTPDGNLGGSQLLKFQGIESHNLPWYDISELKSLSSRYLEAVSSGLIESAHDVSSGGLIQTLCEMGFGSLTGFDVDISQLGGFRTIAKLFSEGGCRMAIECSPDNEEKLAALFKDFPIFKIGMVTEGRVRIEDCGLEIINTEIMELRKPWDSGMELIY
jgi:phosphoribosylformylglycinamidine synthase II